MNGVLLLWFHKTGQAQCQQSSVFTMVSSEAIMAMKSMAKDPKKRAALARDPTCIGGLIIVLSNADKNIVIQALQTLLLLCESSESRQLLLTHVGLADQLKLIDSSNTIDGSVKQWAQELSQRLNEHSVAPLRDSSNLPRRSSNKINSHGETKTKSIVLHIRGLYDKGDRDLCCRLLLNVKGVLSVTFDLERKRCILRTRPDVKPEALASSITRSMTMVAHQVVKNEKGEESLVSFNTSLQDQGGAQETELPDYLSDDSDQSFVGDKAVKPPTEEDKKKSSGWFSAATSFLTNSFYW